MAHGHTGSGVRTVFLHVGTMKTGTTYLQSRLKEHRGALARDGVLTPPGQLTALRDFFSRRGTLDHRRVAGSWAQMISKLRMTDCSLGVVSMEFLSTCTPAEIEAVAAEFAPADLHVVVTVRDLARVMAAQWQETVQNRAVWTWPDYAEQIVDHLGGDVSPSAAASASALAGSAMDPSTIDETRLDDHGPDESATEATERKRAVRRTAAGRFWRQHDVARIVREWSAVVGVDRTHVVTVAPSARPDLLWDRFGQAVGIDANRYPKGAEPVRSNTGLDLAATEFLRRLNTRLDRDISRAAYLRHVKHLLGKSTLVQRGVEVKPTLTPEQHARVVEHSALLVTYMRELGVDVVGDLDELVPGPLAAAPELESGWLERRVTEAAIDGLLSVLRQLDDLEPVIAASPGEPAARPRRAQRRRERLEGQEWSEEGLADRSAGRRSAPDVPSS